MLGRPARGFPLRLIKKSKIPQPHAFQAFTDRTQHNPGNRLRELQAARRVQLLKERTPTRPPSPGWQTGFLRETLGDGTGLNYSVRPSLVIGTGP